MRLWNYISQAFLAPQSLTSTPATAANSLSNPTMANNSNSTVYFGYGSNLWRHQMEKRCPHSEFQGVARLNDYRWLINERGYANVVQLPRHKGDSSLSLHKQSDLDPKSYEDEVWGLVYTLQPTDEERLDINEGVPFAYTKETLGCDFWPVDDDDDSGPANVTARPRKVDMLVYINRLQVEPSDPKEEYVYRMNMGIKDAIEEGIPKKYVEKVMRKFIPESTGAGDVEGLAWKQAVEFEDEDEDED
jgi:gamma-glutamylcyclotransferase